MCDQAAGKGRGGRGGRKKRQGDSRNDFRGDDFAGSAPGGHAVDDHDTGILGKSGLVVVHAMEKEKMLVIIFQALR